MRPGLLGLLECPFCGSPLAVAGVAATRWQGERLRDGVLACACCAFPVVDGVPILRADALARDVLGALDARDHAAALRLALEVPAARQATFEAALAAGARVSFQEWVDVLCDDAEGAYVLHRFADPTFLVSEAVARAVAGALPAPGRALDAAGGSGHLAWVLDQVARARGGPAPVLADHYPWKLWLASRLVVPGADVVACDANAPLPFAAGAFRLAVCSDAFHYVWQRRAFARELLRATEPDGAVVLTHLHNAQVWNPSAGMPLGPAAYARLLAGRAPRLYGDAALRQAVIDAGRLDLAASVAPAALAGEPTLTAIAGGPPALFGTHAVGVPETAAGALVLNPLYARQDEPGRTRLTLRFPSADYEAEFGDSRAYLPERLELAPGDLEDLAALCRRQPWLRARRVVLDVPPAYLAR